MSENNSFYLFLPSNVKSRPENTQSNYLTILPTSKDLKGKWETALVELSFPYSWDNIQNIIDPQTNMKENEFLIKYTSGRYLKVFLKPGRYDSIDKLITRLNHIFKNFEITFSLDEITKRVKIEFSDNLIKYIIMSRKIQFMLGFKERFIEVEKNKNKFIGKYPADVEAGFHNIFIYSNIVAPSIVGNSMVPLLKICPVNGKYGKIITKSFSNPFYIPVLTNYLNSIEIHIKNDLDNFINFAYGNFIIVLHFRKIRSL